MNPPSPSPYLTFLPSPTNPNFFYSHLHHHPSLTTTTNSITSPTPPRLPLPQPPDLPTTLLTLKHLVHLSKTTLHSISTLLPTTATTTAPLPLCPCPFNFHHRLPPESLFRHSLQCPSFPSPLFNLNPLLLHSLRYPNTLKPSRQLFNQNCFLQALHDTNSNLCFSLDNYCDFGPNFFYRNFPGVVSSADRDSLSQTFTLPGILSIQCANFVSNDNGEIKGFSRDCVRLLPLELWLVRSEIESLRDYPIAYSYRVLWIVLCSVMAKDCDFLRWLIVNLPCYDVVNDVPMRDHIVLLF
ncbi:U11/U12 small nuclear ribonucleoprotein 48 kDa protein [Camellia lanceoleosa]|uniref:U11/U12 small nuclear ribonucleoprotein 48 kDa protein n=1 Tax=Camellia lanceoleosa TaxID=1840588 RepID=A0ACC0GT14_9ERIC|nr:U11/U12 small nuclear ribonucleoprotein 48 kDa protein [Camellia lanceoleosa]